MKINIRQLLPEFIRGQFYFQEIKSIRASYDMSSITPEENSERLRLQIAAAKKWRM
jgi:hypothetical protein